MLPLSTKETTKSHQSTGIRPKSSFRSTRFSITGSTSCDGSVPCSSVNGVETAVASRFCFSDMLAT